MLLSAMSVLVVVQSSSEIPEGLMNNPVYACYESSQIMLSIHTNEGNHSFFQNAAVQSLISG